MAFAFSKVGFRVVNYIDDIAGAEHASKATLAFESLAALLSCLGLKESVDKACPPSTSMPFLGIVFDTVAGTLTIPQSKLDEILCLLQEWLGRTRASKKEVQSVIGSLNFLAACIRPGRIYMSRLLNFLRGMPESRSIPLTYEFKCDLRWWHKVSPHFNGVAMMPLADWSEPDGVVACDACLLGCGGWSDGHYFHSAFPPFIQVQSLHINALEMLTLVVALKLWGSGWKGKRIKLFCDNFTSVIVLNTGRSRDPFLQACLREICFLAAKLEFEVRAVHLPGVQNRLPDLLSRWELGGNHRKKFYARTAHLHTVPCTVAPEYFQFSHDW